MAQRETSGTVRIEQHSVCTVLRLSGDDETNRLTLALVCELTGIIEELRQQAPRPLVLTGNSRFFSAGADLNEIARLSGVEAYRFARAGQRLTQAVDSFSSTVFAAISGYCMGGGLDLALACDFRIAAPNAIFGHRGAALGIMTGWSGTQRLARLIGKGQAMQIFIAAEKLSVQQALRLGLIDIIAEDPVSAVLERVKPR